MTAPQATAGAPTPLAPGQVVGGRFHVERPAADDALGRVLAARDAKTGKSIALRVLRASVVPDRAALDILKSECRLAAKVHHRGVIATYGVGSAGDAGTFVACEWSDGALLTEVMAARRSEGRTLSLRGAYHVVTHVAGALAAAHAKTCHGGLRPSVIWVTEAGRLKVGDFGVAKAVLMTAGAQILPAQARAYLAPEVKAGGEPTEASDVFGLAAILYEMLTAKSPAEGFVPPSKLHREVTPAVDELLLKALSADPAGRFGGPGQLREALAPLAALAPEVPPEVDFGLSSSPDPDSAMALPSIPVNVSIPPSRPPAPAAAPNEEEVRRAMTDNGAAVADLPSLPSDGPQAGQRISLHENFRPPAPEPTAPTPSPKSNEVDLKSLLSKITENDAARWMVVKDKLDHGPFSGRELVELILKGDVQEDHGLLNMDTGERRKVRGFAEFGEFLDQYQATKREQEQKAALERSHKVEKVSNAAKLMIAAAVLGVLALVAGVSIVTLRATDEGAVEDADALANLYERGEIEVTGTAGILPNRRGRRGRRGRGHRPRAARSSSGGSGSLSYEEAMNRAVELGDVSQGGGERQLSSADVAGVMNRHINSLYSCVARELGSGGSLSSVQIDLAIAGSGQVLGASARQGSAQFKSCIAGRVRNVRFPGFPAPRMGARFSFSVD